MGTRELGLCMNGRTPDLDVLLVVEEGGVGDGGGTTFDGLFHVQLLNALNEVASFSLRSVLVSAFSWKDIQVWHGEETTLLFWGGVTFCFVDFSFSITAVNPPHGLQSLAGEFIVLQCCAQYHI